MRLFTAAFIALLLLCTNARAQQSADMDNVWSLQRCVQYAIDHNITIKQDSLTARLKASFVFCDAQIAKVTDANLPDQLAMGPPASGRSSSRARLVLIYVGDLIDHYSQMANYMRSIGMLPPTALPRPGRGGGQ